MLTTPAQTQAFVNLFHQGTRLRYKKGQFVIRPGSPPGGVFYIVTGMVKAYDITKYGEENLLIIRKPGEILGLTWAVTGKTRGIMYAALQPTEVLRISREQFTEYLRTQPTAALPLVDMLVEMYRLHSERILNLGYRTVRERLVSFLLTTAERFGIRTPEGLSLNVTLLQQDIASSISATRETTGREITYLEKKGLLRNHRTHIILLDPEKLRSYLK